VGNAAAMRSEYLRRLQEHLDRIESDCKKAHIDFLRLHNADDLLRLLPLHFLRRLIARAP